MKSIEKIIKGLKCHQYASCEDDDKNICPYWKVKTGSCLSRLMKDSIELINKQQKEIDNLKAGKPKKGYWKESTYADDKWHECSECGKVTEKVDKNGNKLICNFCRICGADMRGEQE